jgi:hypothetical protein
MLVIVRAHYSAIIGAQQRSEFRAHPACVMFSHAREHARPITSAWHMQEKAMSRCTCDTRKFTSYVPGKHAQEQMLRVCNVLMHPSSATHFQRQQPTAGRSTLAAIRSPTPAKSGVRAKRCVSDACGGAVWGCELSTMPKVWPARAGPRLCGTKILVTSAGSWRV